MSIQLSIKEMFENGVHFGHNPSHWNPKAKSYIHSKTKDIHIIDLQIAADKFSIALEYIYEMISAGKTILFVSTKVQSAPILKQYADTIGVPYIVNRWLGGTLTNFKTIKGRIKYYKKLKAALETGGLERYTKKEQSQFQKDLVKLEAVFGGIVDLMELPDAIFVVDAKADMIAIKEAKVVGVPVIGFADTNVDPTVLDYAIPGNDDTKSSLEFLLGKINEAILYGRTNPKKIEKKEEKKGEKKPADKVVAKKDAPKKTEKPAAKKAEAQPEAK